jgi:hypothetical protein
MKKITGDVILSNLYLKEIPSILNDVVIEDGMFNIDGNSIKNLNNFPLSCNTLHLSRNPITSLVGIKPKQVWYLEANRTKIKNLEGCPEIVTTLDIKDVITFNSLKGNLKKINTNGNFIIQGCSLSSLDNFPIIEKGVLIYLGDNKITSLLGMPTKCHHLNINNNGLKTLIGCSTHITGNFRCKNNNLEDLDGFPTVIDGDCIMTISPIFNNQLMMQRSYFEKELHKRCRIYGEVRLTDPSNIQI